MSNISGFGSLILRDPIVAGFDMYIAPAVTFTFVENKETDISQGVSKTDCSKILDLDLVDRTSEFTLTLGTQVLDEKAWEFILFDNRKGTAANFVKPAVASGVVTGGSLAVPALTLDQANTSAVILGTTAPGDICLAQQASGTGVTPTTYEISAGSVDVDAIYEGRVLVVFYFEAPASVDVIGGPLPFNPYRNIEFVGKICGTRFADKRLYLPNISSLTGANLDPQAEEFTREYRAFLIDGYELPYVVFDA